MENAQLRKLTACARVIDELMAEGVNVALPVGSCDIDMLAFVDSRASPCGTAFIPIHIVVLRLDDLVSRHLMSEHASGALIALVLDDGISVPIRTFAITSAELALAKLDNVMGALSVRMSAQTDPLVAGGSPVPNAIEPFEMSPGKWRKKLMTIAAGEPRAKSGWWTH